MRTAVDSTSYTAGASNGNDNELELELFGLSRRCAS